MNDSTADTGGDALGKASFHMREALRMLDEDGKASRSAAYLAMALDAMPDGGAIAEKADQPVSK